MDWRGKRKYTSLITFANIMSYFCFVFHHTASAFSVKLFLKYFKTDKVKTRQSVNLPPSQRERVDKHECTVSLSCKLSTLNYAHETGVYHAYATGVYNFWRASEASETLSGVTNGNRRYIFIYQRVR